jgi:hypothetical protein
MIGDSASRPGPVRRGSLLSSFVGGPFSSASASDFSSTWREVWSGGGLNTCKPPPPRSTIIVRIVQSRLRAVLLLSSRRNCRQITGGVHGSAPTNEDRTLSQRAVGISETDKLKETLQLLASLWDAAQRLPEGSDRQDTLEQIGGFHRRVEAFIGGQLTRLRQPDKRTARAHPRPRYCATTSFGNE